MFRGRMLPFVTAVLLATNVFAQGLRPGAATSANVEWHFRHELFQMLLEERGLTTEGTLEAALASPQDSVLVMFGKLNRFQVADSGKLLPFVAQGGTVLVASDRSGTMGVIASFVSGPISSVEAETQYQGLTDCLRIADVDRSHPLMQGVDEIIVNRSGWLSILPSSSMKWEVVATVPQTCSPRRCRGQPLIAVSQSDTPAAGLMIVAADPTLFTNSMMWHGDNATLAIRVSEMLCRGRKNRLAFLVDGQALPSYRSSPLLKEPRPAPSPDVTPPPRPPLPQTPPKPTLETTLRLANTVIQNVEASNILNEAIVDHPRRPNARLYPLVILFVLVAITAAWLLSKLTHTGAVRPPLPEVRDMQTAQDLSKTEMDAPRGYGMAAQTLARDLCQELTGSRVPADWQQGLTGPAPPPWRKTLNQSQRRNLATIVELAASHDVPHISPRHLKQIGATIRRLRTLHRAATQAAATPVTVAPER